MNAGGRGGRGRDTTAAILHTWLCVKGVGGSLTKCTGSTVLLSQMRTIPRLSPLLKTVSLVKLWGYTNQRIVFLSGCHRTDSTQSSSLESEVAKVCTCAPSLLRSQSFTVRSAEQLNSSSPCISMS